MRTRWGIFLVLVLFIAPFFSHAQYSGEYVASFAADIVLEEDSSFVVTERIEYVFSGEKHGIYRYIPTAHPDPAPSVIKERYTEIEILSILQDGMPAQQVTEYEPGQVYLKIGNPASTLSGTHIYEITYRVRGGISFPQNAGADLYWNVTGNEWEVPIKYAEARLSSVGELFMRERSCYKGESGLSSSCDQVRDSDGAVIFSTSNLLPTEGMTVAQAVNRSAVQKVEFVRIKSLVLIIPAMLVWFIGLALFVYRYRTANETGRTIIAQYEPYSGAKPMYTGLLFDGKLDARDITACIVYLAQQGFITIKKTERTVVFFFKVVDFEVILRKPLSESQSEFERSILNLLFAYDAEPGTVVALSELKNDLAEQQANRLELIALKEDLEKDLEVHGFFQRSLWLTFNDSDSVIRVFGAIFILVVLGAMVPDYYFFKEVFFFGSMFILASARRRRTRKGFEALDHLKGFRLFLATTEKDRYDFHNAPEKSPEQFMEYLPYAIAFGVEEKWAEVFKDVTIPNPGWYDGGTGAHSFSGTHLTTSLGAFATAFVASSGTANAASSGGGSSGGGGGGGGGGSW